MGLSPEVVSLSATRPTPSPAPPAAASWPALVPAGPQPAPGPTQLRLEPRHHPQGPARSPLRHHLPRRHLLPRTQAGRVPPAPSARRHPRHRPGPLPDRPHLSDHPAVLPPDGRRGPPPVDPAQGLHRRATAQPADDRGQTERLGLPAAQGGQVPPPKKVKQTEAIFANVKEVHEQAAAEGHTLRLSLDTKATVAIGPFSRGGQSRTVPRGPTTTSSRTGC